MSGQNTPLKRAELIASRVAGELGLEFVDVELVKEPMGRFLRFYVDREGGISIDEVEQYHKTVAPLMDDIDYDYMEVSSPGLDRPLKKPADFERAAGMKVEVKLYRPMDGSKLFTGELAGLKEGRIGIIDAAGNALSFEQKAVALCRPVLEFDEEDLEDEIPETEE